MDPYLYLRDGNEKLARLTSIQALKWELVAAWSER